jgi:DNA polymerase-3 subunit delta
MKWTTKQLDGFLKQPQTTAPPFVVVYGEDAGLAKDYATKIAEHVCADMNDPFLVDRFRVEDVVDNPQCLLEAIQTISLGAGHKLVYLQGVSKDLHINAKNTINKAIQDVLNGLTEATTFVFAASGYDAKLALIKSIEKHKDAIAVRCYQDTDYSLQPLLQKKFSAENKTIQPDAMAFLINNLGNDRAVTLSEIEKILLYTLNENQITLQNCLDCLSAAPSVNAFKLCDAIGLRQKENVLNYLHFLKEEGQDSSMILAMVIRHMRRLMQVQQMQGQGSSLDQAMMSLKPPVFYGKQEFSAQVRGYPAKRLESALQKLLTLQHQSREGVVNPEVLVERGLLSLSF